MKKAIGILKIQNWLLKKYGYNASNYKSIYFIKWIRFILENERKNFNEELNDINIVLNENLVRENFFRTKFKLLFSES